MLDRFDGQSIVVAKGNIMEQELKPCPFCGGAASLQCTGSPHAKRGWYPTCSTLNCPAVTDEQDEQGGTHFDHWTKAEAIAAWNTRAQPASDSELVDRIKKLEAALLKIRGPYNVRIDRPLKWARDVARKALEQNQ